MNRNETLPVQFVLRRLPSYPFEVRDVLMVAARTRLFAVRWTDAILDEMARNLIKDGLGVHATIARGIAHRQPAEIDDGVVFDVVPAYALVRMERRSNHQGAICRRVNTMS